MPWLLLDLLLYVLATAVAVALAYLLYKRVRVLARAVGAASRQVAEYTPGLQVNQPVRASAGDHGPGGRTLVQTSPEHKENP